MLKSSLTNPHSLLGKPLKTLEGRGHRDDYYTQLCIPSVSAGGLALSSRIEYLALGLNRCGAAAAASDGGDFFLWRCPPGARVTPSLASRFVTLVRTSVTNRSKEAKDKAKDKEKLESRRAKRKARGWKQSS